MQRTTQTRIMKEPTQKKLNPTTCKIFNEQILKDVRANAFSTILRFVNYEIVEGDICEFGCYTGRSLSALAYFHQQYTKNENKHNRQNLPERQIYGFDSFRGLEDSEGHPRWDSGLFSTNHSFHPTISLDENVTPEKVVDYFEKYDLGKPNIIENHFDNLNIDCIDKIAIAHIDCDLYSSTKRVLELIKPKLVQGSIIMFDDWYNFKADVNKGEQKAFYEFLDENLDYMYAEEFLRYATFCKAFVITKIKNKI